MWLIAIFARQSLASAVAAARSSRFAVNNLSHELRDPLHFFWVFVDGDASLQQRSFGSFRRMSHPQHFAIAAQLRLQLSSFLFTQLCHPATVGTPAGAVSQGLVFFSPRKSVQRGITACADIPQHEEKDQTQGRMLFHQTHLYAFPPVAFK